MAKKKAAKKTKKKTSEATTEKAHGAAANTQDVVPSLSVPAHRSIDQEDQSDPTGLGELLCGRTLEPLLLVYSKLGGKEDSETSGARPTAPRLRLEAMESTVDLRNSRTI